MPDSETTAQTKTKQPTGSSKRKRKQSIKRNILGGTEPTSSASLKGLKLDKTYGKRLRSSPRGKLSKDSKQEIKLDVIRLETNEEICRDDTQMEHLTQDEIYAQPEEDERKERGENECSVISKCSSNSIQCQNCKFCSEHKEIKGELDDPTGKRTKKKFPCEICAKEGSPKVYNSLEKHRHHMATVHEIYGKEIKRFECTECPERVWFPTKSKFMYHLGTKHPGIIKFICEVCTETFKLKANYKNHMKTHNIVVQKKFSCDICNGTFVNKAGFEAHKKRFPGPHIKQSCSHCGFSFSREKHLINHRCKTLLLEEAAAARANAATQSTPSQPVVATLPTAEDPLKIPDTCDKRLEQNQTYLEKKEGIEISVAEGDHLQKKGSEAESPGNKRVVLHRIVPRRSQEHTIYRPVQMTNQNVPESVVVQELREIDFENGTFIAAPAPGGEQEQQSFIVRDVNGHLVQGNQILHLDLNDIQAGEESQVYLADWNIVTPYVIREKSP